jgi:hypothetical protein
VVVQRSDPSIIDEIYGEAVQDFYNSVETRIAGMFPGGTLPETSLGAGIGAFFNATKRTPEVIIVAPDVWGELADAKQLDAVVGAGGVATEIDGLSSTFAGIAITASAVLDPGMRLLATRRAVDVRVTDPVRLTANAIGALNVELAVVGEGLFDIDYPDELLALTAPGPASRSSSK